MAGRKQSDGVLKLILDNTILASSQSYTKNNSYGGYSLS